MKVSLHVEPNTVPMSWQRFRRLKDVRAVALDGYVSSGPRFTHTGPYANFNHHEGVSRLETRATCAQVLLAVRQGMYDRFVDPGTGHTAVDVYVNDCDEDVCLSVFILQNPHLALSTMNPLLNRLVFMEDMLDTTAGAYPFPKELGTLGQLMWVFAPYHNFRVNGGIDKRSREQFEDIISSVGRRIMDFITGKTESVELDTRYDVVETRRSGSCSWHVLKEIGPNARVGVFGDGIKAFLACRQRPDGKWSYSVGRMSHFVYFPIPLFFKALNKAEGNMDGDLWGGSDTIGGSPRVNGSKLSPAEVCRVMESVL